ncbi:monooxygenase [Halioglobus japonicus]|uniref:4-hydroxyacetophenone monooxygenase n=2 Tax=Halioglobus japonicus TaxID=930805 RepID=A0AAP8MGI0_9GAMM|nr:NAD(P)/FAD-dependent oxidoreductase [Halioglobus japonicus]PLW87461.1 4-hydroxyacetophenone monooxygenase [Halioglobus japonicus]GHD08347.1 monooxygenase [Halioglobus japonicus]
MSQTANMSDILDVLVVGAGFGGICAGIKLREAGIDNFGIYDKAAGIGGTWWHNTYPGAACDIESHLYCYSFEPNPDWSRKYSPQPEIQAYIEHCANKYGIRDQIHLQREIRQHALVDGLWRTTFADGQVQWSRHIIFATGGLHVPAFPDIPGTSDFQGTSMHSAEWDHTVDFSKSRVAVIGSAASAIQLVPELAKVAAHVDVYQRTPNYIAARNDFAYPGWMKKLFANVPGLTWLYRQCLFYKGDLGIYPIVKTSKETRRRTAMQNMVKSHIRSSVDDTEMAEQLIPDYPMGCKRILIADNFYSSLNRDNVALVTEGIQAITAEGVNTNDNRHHPADIIVYATGFDMEKHLVAIEVIGADGKTLEERWDEGRPDVYKGGFIPGLPNFYMTTGPNTGTGTTSVVGMIEAQMKLIMQAIDLTGNNQLIEPTTSACSAYVDDIRNALRGTVWGAGACKSWYVNDKGENDTLYPYSASTFRRDHETLQLDDFSLYARS